MDKLPDNCVPVVIKKLARYKYYKPNSQQFKAGIKGRWQEFNGYGWDNMAEEPLDWENAEDKYIEESKGGSVT